MDEMKINMKLDAICRKLNIYYCHGCNDFREHMYIPSPDFPIRTLECKECGKRFKE